MNTKNLLSPSIKKPKPTYTVDRVAVKMDTTNTTVYLLAKKLWPNKKFSKRRRNIFYDTDGFNESQNETLKICNECSGVLNIDSSSDIGHHILAVHIPRKACRTCRELGFEWYDSANERSYDMIILQDRVNDRYLVRKRS